MRQPWQSTFKEESVYRQPWHRTFREERVWDVLNNNYNFRSTNHEACIYQQARRREGRGGSRGSFEPPLRPKIFFLLLPFITLCTTRWGERSEAYEHFYESFEYVVDVLEVMAHNLHHVTTVQASSLDAGRQSLRGCLWTTPSRYELWICCDFCHWQYYVEILCMEKKYCSIT